MQSCSLPKSHRIRRSHEFKTVFQRGKKYHLSSFTVYALAKEEGPTRLGLVVSRKVGGAFLRNRYKRIIREYFRSNYASFPPLTDIVVRMKPLGASIDSATLRCHLELLTTIGSK